MLGKTLVPAYLLVIVAGAASFVAGTVFRIQRQDETAFYSLQVPGLIALFGGVVIGMVLLYRCWKLVIDHGPVGLLLPAVRQPGQAVGFLLIPAFNLYWVFVAFGKLPASLNALADATGVRRRVSEGLGFTVAVLAVLGCIPLIGVVFAVMQAFVMPTFLVQASSVHDGIVAARSSTLETD